MALWNSTFFGDTEGDKNTASSSSSTTNTTTTSTDKRLVVDGGGIGLTIDNSPGLAFTSTDHDAIKSAFDLAKTSSNNGLNSIQAAVNFAADTLKVAGEATKDASAGVASAYQTAQDSATGLRFVVGAGLVVAGVVALFMFGRRKAAA